LLEGVIANFEVTANGTFRENLMAIPNVIVMDHLQIQLHMGLQLS
jgi:hypothetical protein